MVKLKAFPEDVCSSKAEMGLLRNTKSNQRYVPGVLEGTHVVIKSCRPGFARFKSILSFTADMD